MKILFSIGHPAHVHLFKNVINELMNIGHEVKVIAVNKEISKYLLDSYGIDYINFGDVGKNKFIKLFRFIISIFKIRKIIKEFKPDLALGVAAIRIGLARIGTKTRCLVFTDTEHATNQIIIFKPLSNFIFTPDCFLNDLGPKQIRYPGYHELAYLHPNRFTPNPEVLKEIGLNEYDKFFIVRFVSWEASHDIGHKGLSLVEKRKLIETLKSYGKIIISSEKELPKEFEEYRMRICQTKMHDLLYYATMYVGEGGTMASEAACLGTYSILVNPLVAGTFEELKNKYQLLLQETNIDIIISNINHFLSEPNNLKDYQLNYQRLLNDKSDVTEYLIDLISNNSIKS